VPIPSASSGIIRDVLGAWIVDLLPRRLWRPGNLYGNRWLGYKLHFCSGPGKRWSVRTVEWSGREVARGKRPFEFHQGEAEGAKPWLQRWPDDHDDT
jgi:hypothetical protein